MRPLQMRSLRIKVCSRPSSQYTTHQSLQGRCIIELLIRGPTSHVTLTNAHESTRSLQSTLEIDPHLEIQLNHSTICRLPSHASQERVNSGKSDKAAVCYKVTHKKSRQTREQPLSWSYAGYVEYVPLIPVTCTTITTPIKPSEAQGVLSHEFGAHNTIFISLSFKQN